MEGKCSICCDIYSKEIRPCLVSCGHSLCENCCKNEKFHCPIDNCFPNSDPPVNYQLLEYLTDEVAEAACHVCHSEYSFPNHLPTIFSKCGHTFYCQNCLGKTSHRLPKCPLCNSSSSALLNHSLLLTCIFRRWFKREGKVSDQTPITASAEVQSKKNLFNELIQLKHEEIFLLNPIPLYLESSLKELLMKYRQIMSRKDEIEYDRSKVGLLGCRIYELEQELYNQHNSYLMKGSIDRPFYFCGKKIHPSTFVTEKMLSLDTFLGRQTTEVQTHTPSPKTENEALLPPASMPSEMNLMANISLPDYQQIVADTKLQDETTQLSPMNSESTEYIRTISSENASSSHAVRQGNPEEWNELLPDVPSPDRTQSSIQGGMFGLLDTPPFLTTMPPPVPPFETNSTTSHFKEPQPDTTLSHRNFDRDPLIQSLFTSLPKLREQELIVLKKTQAFYIQQQKELEHLEREGTQCHDMIFLQASRLQTTLYRQMELYCELIYAEEGDETTTQSKKKTQEEPRMTLPIIPVTVATHAAPPPIPREGIPNHAHATNTMVDDDRYRIRHPPRHAHHSHRPLGLGWDQDSGGNHEHSTTRPIQYALSNHDFNQNTTHTIEPLFPAEYNSYDEEEEDVDTTQGRQNLRRYYELEEDLERDEDDEEEEEDEDEFGMEEEEEEVDEDDFSSNYAAFDDDED